MRSILNGCTMARFDIPINYYPRTFQSSSGKSKCFSIENGKVLVSTSNNVIDTVEKEYDSVYTVTESGISSEVDEEKKKKFMSIYSSVLEGIRKYYEGRDVHLTLKLALSDDGVTLLNESSCQFVDNSGTKKDNEKNAIVQYIAECISHKLNRDKCCSCSVDFVGKTKYLVPKYLYLLKRIMDKYPKEDHAEMRSLAKASLKNFEKRVNTCVSCLSDYIALDRISDCSHEEKYYCANYQKSEILSELDLELFDSKKAHGGISKNILTPYSFSLNLKYSPYRDDFPYLMKRPPLVKKPITRSSSLKNGSLPDCVKKSIYYDSTAIKFRERPATSLLPPQKPNNLPVYKEIIPESQLFAKKMYSTSMELIDRKKKRLPPKNHTEGEFTCYILQI